MNVTVVGAGIGGLAVAGHAALSGCDTSVYDVDQEVVSAIADRGGIEVRGREEGFGPIATATTDPRQAVRDADLVIVCTQGPDVGAAATALSPFLSHPQAVVVVPGGTGGALVFRHAIRDPEVIVAEADAFPYGCSIPEPAVALISSSKRSFGVAAAPASQTHNALAALHQVFPQAEAADTVLHTGLTNINAILHVAPMISNVGRIEHLGGTFDFYGEAITPSVARLMADQDAERLRVAAAYGVKVPTLLEWIAATYGVQGDDLQTVIQMLHKDVYGPSAAPSTLEHRYLTEDVPCGAVPVVELGRIAGVDMAVTRHSIVIASVLLGRDLWTEGRTAARLGLADLSPKEILEHVT